MTCQERKRRMGAIPGKMKTFPVDRIMQCISVDLITTLPKTARGNVALAVFSEGFTKFKIVEPIPNLEASTVARVYVERVICTLGVPETLLSDRGSQFLSELVTELNKYLGVQKLNTSSYHPQTDGEVERFNATLMEQLACRTSIVQDDWDLYVHVAQSAYNTSIHEATGDTPHFLLFGRDAPLPLEVALGITELDDKPATISQHRTQLIRALQTAHSAVAKNLIQAAEKAKEGYDQKRVDVHHEVGDLVLLHRPQLEPGKSAKLARLWTGPYRVVATRGELNYDIVHVANPKDKQLVHVARLKPFKEHPRNVVGPSNLGGEGVAADEQQDVEGILDERVESDGTKSYLVKWRGFTRRYNEWVPEHDMQAPELLQQFRLTHKKDSSKKAPLPAKDPPSKKNIPKSTPTSTMTKTRSLRAVIQPSRYRQ